MTSKKTFSPVKTTKSARFSDHIAVFYPKGYDACHHQPSLALVDEPKAVGPVPRAWQVRPTFSANDTQFRFEITLDRGTSLYGMGEVTGPLERRGTSVTLWNTDNWAYSDHDGKRLYQSHPWILGVRKDGSAFGVLADTTWCSEINLKRTIAFTTTGPACRVIVIDHDSPQAVMSGLAKLTGTMEMPPLWALGYQQCRWSYYPDTRVREIADGFRSRKIPCDVIWMDIHYMDGYRVFTFDKEHFPKPEKTNGYLHKKGFKSVWMVDPGIKAEEGYDVYDSGTKKDVWVKDKDGNEFNGKVWPGQCAFPDFTRPETCQWWADHYRDFMAHGIDGVWNDMNEPAVGDGPDSTMPTDNHHRGGGDLPAGPHARYHNVYGMLMVKASREGMLACNPNKRPFVLTRSNFLGGHRYAATWTGDNSSSWNHLKLSIPMSLTLGLSGQPFNGPDIGGFCGKATRELWGHWIAVGALMPFSRGHAASGTPDKEPWAFGARVEKAARVALERRYRLMPYFYTLFHESSKTGLPVMRPVFFADPANAKLRKEERAFLLGDDLLVIPKWADDVVLPAGFTKSVSLVGEQTKRNKYQCDLRIRDGAIIPLTKVMQSTEDFDHDDLTLMVRLGADGTAAGELYEDAGDGFGYKNGDYRLTRYRAERVDGKVTLSIVSSEGNWPVADRTIRVQIIHDNRVKVVQLDEKSLRNK